MPLSLAETASTPPGRTASEARLVLVTTCNPGTTRAFLRLRALLKFVPGTRRLINRRERDTLPLLFLPDARWRALDLFDAITLAIAITHTEGEVRGWMSAAGCEGLHSTDWCATSLAGARGATL